MPLSVATLPPLFVFTPSVLSPPFLLALSLLRQPSLSTFFLRQPFPNDARARSLYLSLSHTHTLSLSHTHTLSLTLSLSLSRSGSCSRARSRSGSRARARSRSLARALSPGGIGGRRTFRTVVTAVCVREGGRQGEGLAVRAWGRVHSR
jgi:hypothetical protein